LPQQQQKSAPTLDSISERMGRRMVIRRDPETGRRRIEVDGKVFPTLTRGDVGIREVRMSSYRDSGEVWPNSPDDVQVPCSGKVVCYEVVIQCFVDEGNLEIEDPNLVVFLPPVGPS
jgi:hypothetical protein